MVRSRGSNDDTDIHVGVTICEGPGFYRMVRTRPYEEAGEIIEIPREAIKSVIPLAPRSIGEEPEPA